MTAKITSSINSFLAYSIMSSLGAQNPPERKTNQTYNVGDKVTSAANVYVAVQGGKTGTSESIDSKTGIIVDGSVSWVYLHPAIGDTQINSNLYVGIGRKDEWDNENSPPAPVTGLDSQKDVAANLITLLKASDTNLRMGLKKNEWVSGTVYHQYTGTDADENETNLYVTVDSEQIFKCIDNNNGGQSTEKPNVSQTGYLKLSDGYVWKYMGSILAIDLGTFGTSNHLPLSKYPSESDKLMVVKPAMSGEITNFKTPYVKTGTGTIASTATVMIWEPGTGTASTPANAAADLNSGEVEHIYATSPGAEYSDGTMAIAYDGDASSPDPGVECTLTLVGGEVTSATLDGATAEYPDGAVAVIIGDGTGAEVSVNFNGNQVSGFDVTAGGTDYTWAECVVVPGDAAWTSEAVLGPTGGHGANISTELSADAMLFSFKVSNENTPYVEDCEFRQISLFSNVGPQQNSLRDALAYIGPQHTRWQGGQLQLNKYSPQTGHMLLLNNIQKIDHSSGQEETLKITVQF